MTLEDVGKTYDGDRVLWDGLNLTLRRGQRLGVVGENGSGKSTLLRMLGGTEVPTDGTITVKKGVAIATLDQDPLLTSDPQRTVLDAVFDADGPAMAAVRRYECALAALNDAHGGDEDPGQDRGAGEFRPPPGGASSAGQREELEAAMEEVSRLEAWGVESSAHEALERLGIGRRLLGQSLVSLSGGQRKRVALAQTLLQTLFEGGGSLGSVPTVLVLDEPTNHLDVGAVEWLERLLVSEGVTLLLVTHDRYFLEATCPEILELDQGGKSYVHSIGGSYATFLRAREARLAAEAGVVQRARVKLRTEAEWMRRQPKARATKARYREDMFHELKATASKKRSDRSLALDGASFRLGSEIVKIEGAWLDVAHLAGGPVAENRTLLADVTFALEKGQRVGVVGANGVGKSSFMDVVAGTTSLKAGARHVGETVRFGYFSQVTPEIPADTTALQWVHDHGGERLELDSGESASALQVLERFGFTRSQLYRPAGKFSGGEKRRLYLVSVLMQRPNVLLLDEPTNDLDLDTIGVLEDYCLGFKGVIVMVSHDRAFMNAVATTLFVFEAGGNVKEFNGVYDEYAAYLKDRRPQGEATVGEGQRAHEVDEKKEASKAPSRDKGQKALSAHERRELERLEAAVEDGALRCEALEAELAVAGADFVKVQELTERLDEARAALDADEGAWLELAERA